MPDSWYYARANQQYGPVAHVALMQMYSTGQVLPTDLVWSEGMADWLPALQALGPVPGGTTAAALPYPAPYPASPYQSPGYPAQPGYYYGQGYSAPAYAGFWRRAVAYIIDWIVLCLFNTCVVGSIAGAVATSLGIKQPRSAFDLNAPPPTPDQILFSLAFLAVMMAVAWLYYALLESSPKQATLGKMALGLYVTDANGARIGFARASGRFFGKILSLAILGIGFIMAGITERKQALHDLLADTLVLRRP